MVDKPQVKDDNREETGTYVANPTIMASARGELKERNLGGIVEELFRVCGRNLLPFIGLVAALEIPLAK